jgi:hypothetical protein
MRYVERYRMRRADSHWLIWSIEPKLGPTKSLFDLTLYLSVSLGAGAKSYMTNGFLINDKILAHFFIYCIRNPSSYMTEPEPEP